jgi:superoxide dismutase
MTYSMKPLACDSGKLRGLSEKLILSYYENNYAGAVKRLNAISAQLANMDFAGAVPIFALDMYEHSYHIDYGAKAAAYVDAFMQNINWQSAARRLPQGAGGDS